jgi:four helix bundle protein
MTNYKTLKAWILSMEIVKDGYALTKLYPVEERYGLASQTNRATVSIPTNIAEGMGRSSSRDTIHFLHISRGSAYEVETLLNVALMISIIDQKSFENLNSKVEETIKIINGLIKYLERKI